MTKAAAMAQPNEARVPMITYSLTARSSLMVPKRRTDLAAIRKPMASAMPAMINRKISPRSSRPMARPPFFRPGGMLMAKGSISMPMAKPPARVARINPGGEGHQSGDRGGGGPGEGGPEAGGPKVGGIEAEGDQGGNMGGLIKQKGRQAAPARQRFGQIDGQMGRGKGQKFRAQAAGCGDNAGQHDGRMGEKRPGIALVCRHPVGLEHEIGKGVGEEEGGEGGDHRAAAASCGSLEPSNILVKVIAPRMGPKPAPTSRVLSACLVIPSRRAISA